METYKTTTMYAITAEELSEMFNKFYQTQRKREEEEANKAMERATMTRKEVCNAIGISSSTLWRWSKDGTLTPVKAGVKCLYRRSDVMALLTKAPEI